MRLCIALPIILSACGGISAHEENVRPSPVKGAPAEKGREHAALQSKEKASHSSAAPVLAPRRLEHLPLATRARAVTCLSPSKPDRGYRVAVVAHGAGGTAEQHCRHWEPFFALDVALLCLAGTPLRKAEPEGGSFFASHLELAEEINELLGAAQEKWGSDLRPGWLFLGYSQGATMGALALVSSKPHLDMNPFTDLILIEGGGRDWSLARAQIFKKAGGSTVSLICGTQGCERLMRRSQSVFTRARISGLWHFEPRGGHAYWGVMEEGSQRALSEIGWSR